MALEMHSCCCCSCSASFLGAWQKLIEESAKDQQAGTAQQVGWNQHTRAVGELLGLD